ncbi:ribonuclease H family protein [Paenibacillus sp. IB182496]|uniref:Ribonuclease H n=1 Tax=Paenibacillus sabuli TaxID=2772509 RepID=A0A927BQD7_9BACL|nr:ribonuclease H family protein [Paenibacillus sabuli]MBD2844813.1 ribonuclease H family protein [Paenibacillus sabuli]
MSKKHYVVWAGKTPGVYDSWPACQAQVTGYPEAKYKSYATRALAEAAYKDGWKKHWGRGGKAAAPAGEGKAAGARAGAGAARRPGSKPAVSPASIDYDSVSVDVGTHGNPGPIEYKGVDTATGELLFQVGPIPNGTNNLGEFIAIVHALSYLKARGSARTVYTDSRTALAWIRNKKIASTLRRDASTAQVWALADRAMRWLHENDYPNKIVKWETESWGEIKADFGRK